MNGLFGGPAQGQNTNIAQGQGQGGLFQSFANARNNFSGTSQDFLNSNSIVAKFAFLILVLLIFIALLQLGSRFLTWVFSLTKNPILIPGMVNGKQMMRIPQDPTAKGAIPIMRSQNADDGLEFSWSVWIFVDDFSYKEHEYKHIFHKGNDNINMDTAPMGLNFPNNGPGLYITPDTNNLLVIMNTFDTITEEVLVKDLPINKWVCVVIRVTKQNQLDVYINGSLSKRYMLKSVPKQNYGDVYVNMNGGFSGFTSALRYFDYALGTNEIQNLLDAGPKMKMVGSQGDGITGSQPQYLSNRWYFKGADSV
jgi:hypothetical protein